MSNTPWFLEPILPKHPKIAKMLPPLGGTYAKTGDNEEYSSDKTLLEILAKLKDTAQLNELEWILVFRLDEQYRAMNDTDLKSATQVVWRAVLSDENRFSKLVSKLVSGLARGYVSLAEALALTFPKDVPRQFDKATQQKARLTCYMLNEKFSDCAQLTLEQSIDIETYFRSLGLEEKGEHITKIASYAEAVMPLDPSSHKLTWWSGCQNKIDRADSVKQLERLLKKIRVVASGTPFETWINNHCLPDSVDTYWFSLSEKARLTLKSFFNVTEFSTVSKVFDLLIETSDVGGLNEHQVRNLRSRISFWDHYTHQFQRVRFFLTERSSRLLSEKVNLEELRVQTMDSKYLNNQSEICIFDVGRFFLVERFIGTNFDLGVFAKTDELEAILFGRNYLDAEDISRLEPEWVLHHLAHYQRRFAGFLRTRGISPNKSGERWLRPLRPEEVAQIDNDTERHYRGVINKAILFKTGKRY